mgnify:CR=1 FL=1
MNPETITLILNIILYSFIGLIILKTIIGIFRGTWKSLNSLIITLACYAVIIFLNGKFTELYYNMNLSMLNLSFNIDGTIINVNTIGQALRDVVILLSGESLNLSPSSEIFLICDGLACSILSLFVFIVHFILTAFIIAPLLSLIFYHLVFKFIVGRKRVKKKNAGLRIGGSIISLVKATVTCSLFIMPFSAIASQISTAVKGYNLSTEDTKEFEAYVDAYQNSYLAKLMTGINVNNNSIDVEFTSYITTAKMGKDVTSFMDEIDTFVEIACDGLSEGVFNLSEGTINMVNLISKEFVTRTLIRLASSSLVTTLLPVALSIVVNLDNVKEYIDLTEIDWYSIDWSDELTALSDIYEEFADTGILMNYIVNQEDINSYEFTRDNYKYFHNTFMNLNKSEVLGKVMPYVLSSFAKNLDEQQNDFSGIFPTEVEAYSKVNLGNELSTIYDAIMTFSDFCHYHLNRNLRIGDFSNEDTVNSLINFIISDIAVNGGEGGVYTNESEGYKITTSSIFDGVYNDESVKVYNGILDSELLLDNMESILKVVGNLEQVKEYGITEAINEVAMEINTKEDWQREIHSLLGILPIVLNNPNLDLEHFDVSNEAQVNELSRIAPFIDESVIVKKMAKPILEYVLKNENVELPFGLELEMFNFECDKLGTDLTNVLKTLPSIMKVQKAFDSEGTNAIFDKESFNVDSLEKALNTIYNSDVLNPRKDLQSNELTNFETIILNIFNDQAFADLGLSVDEKLLISIRNSLNPSNRRMADDGWKYEIGHICNALRALQEAQSFKIIFDKTNSGQEIDINDVNGDDIYNVFIEFNNSTIIHNSIGNIFNSVLSESMNQMGLALDFCCVEDWDTEISNLRDIINLVENMNKNGFNLMNIDITSLNYTYEENGITKDGIDDLESIIKSLYKLQCLQYEMQDEKIVESYAFEKFIYNNITENVFKQFINEDNEQQIIDDHNLVYRKQDGTLFKSEDGSERIVNWVNEDGSIGEIDELVELVRYILKDQIQYDSNGDGFIDEDDEYKDTFISIKDGITTIDLNSAINDASKLDELLSKLNNIYAFRTLFGVIVEDTLAGDNSSTMIEGLDISLINCALFSKTLTMDLENESALIKNRSEEIASRKNEIDSLASIYDDILKLKSSLGDGDWNLTLTNIGGEVNTIQSLLEKMASSNLFNVNNDGKDRTFFQDMMIYVLNQSGLSKMMVSEESSSNNISLDAVMSIDNTAPENNKWIGENGEISKFISVIDIATSNQAISNLLVSGADSNEYLTKISGDDISTLIKAISKSNVLNYNNSLGNILNNQLKSSFSYDTIGLHVQFDKVTDWNSEAETLGLLIDSLKSLNGDTESTSLNLNFDIATLNADVLKTTLKSLNGLQAVQNACDEQGKIYDDNFGEFVYNRISKEAFNIYINDSNDNLVLNDHILKNQSEIKSSWDTDIDLIGNLIDVIQKKDEVTNEYIYLKKVNDKYQLDSEKMFNNKEDLRLIVKRINSIYCLRTIVSEVIKTEIPKISTVIALDNTYVDLFDIELNYLNDSTVIGNKKEVNTRLEEISKRDIELDNIVDILLLMDSLVSIDDLSNIGEQTIDSMTNVLFLLHNSRIFNSEKIKVAKGQTAFEDTIKYVLDKTTISEMVYDSKYDIGLNQDQKIYQIINEITAAEKLPLASQNPACVWTNGASNIGELNDSVLGSFDKLLKNLITLQDADGQKITNINQINSLSSESVKIMLDSLNKCYLSHDAVSKLTETVFVDKVKINDYIFDDTPSLTGRYIDNKYTTFGEKVAHWEKDITIIADLYHNLANTNDGLGIIDGQNGSVEAGVFSKILPSIGQLETLCLQRADIIYSIFDKANISKYISEYPNATSTHKQRDLIAYLIANRINKSTETETANSWNKEANSLDKLTNIILANDGKTIDPDDNIISSNDFYTAIESTYIYDSEIVVNYNQYEMKYNRSYFASELVSSFIIDLGTQVDSSLQFNIREGVNNIAYSYEGLNRFEAEGIKGLLDYTIQLGEYYDSMKNNITTFNYDNWKSEFLQSTRLIGNENNELERFYYLGNNNYNSIIAMKLYSSVSNSKTTQITSLINETNEALLLYNTLNGTTYHINPISRWVPNEGESFEIFARDNLLPTLDQLNSYRTEILQ